MITQMPTDEMFAEWKAIWAQYKDQLPPNRKSGAELISFLQSKYVLTEITDKNALNAVTSNVNMNACYSEKLPKGIAPSPRAFYLENKGEGDVFYKDKHKDSNEIWGDSITKIFVGIDEVSGFYMVEGSTLLHDELVAFQGLDEKDIQNYVCVSQYILALKKFDLM